MKTKYLAIIYKGVINNQPLSDINKQITDATVNGEKRLYNFALTTAKRAKNRDTGQGLEVLANDLVLLFSKMAYNHKANVIINTYVREQDDEAKKDLLDKMLRDRYRPFYMASWHKDSAEDHKDWQGKLYYDAKATDPAVLKYARDHHLRTVQWVTGKPVWFVTRPYCRHYFMQYTLAQVLKGVKPKTRKVGNRALQTPARVNVDYYTDRLTTLKALYAVKQTPLLRRQMDKTKLLIKKWRGEI